MKSGTQATVVNWPHDLVLSGMASHPDPISPQTDDTESLMRQNLGIGGTSSSPSSSNDPLKAARQAIRSQVTAREYTERQLAQAQGAIQDLRTKLRHVHQERETAISAAQSAMTAKDAAERTMRAAGKALATERANRARTEGMLRDAEATIRDLREKLATANQALGTMRAELAAERLVQQKIVESSTAAMTAEEIAVAAVRDAAVPIIRRPVGRPRKTAVADRAETPIWPMTQPQVIRDNAVPAVRRPVGRPRKTVVVLAEQSVKPTKKSQATAKPVTKRASQQTDDQEPVQWWVEGWRKR
jgi:hypothetical protein